MEFVQARNKKKAKVLVAIFVIIVTIFFNIKIVNATETTNANVEKVKNSTVRVVVFFYDANNSLCGYSLGSGFAIGDSEPVQYIVTNHHVIDPTDLIDELKKKYSITVASRKIQVIMGRDDYITLEDQPEIDLSDTDIAVLKLKKPLNIPPITFDTSTNVKLTQSVFALGFPGVADVNKIFPTGQSADITITNGVISKITEDYRLNGVKEYQTNAAINSGNSGGALVDENGNVIGIVVSIVGTADAKGNVVAAQGIGFAIQSDELLPLLDNRGIKYKKAGSQTAAVTSKQVSDSKTSSVTPTLIDKHASSNSNNILMVIIIAVICIAILIVVAIIVLAAKGKKNEKYNKTDNRGQKMPVDSQLQPQKRVKSAILYGINGDFAGSEIKLGSEAITFGRDPRICQLVFQENNTDVGRKHCTIRYIQISETVILEDCFSTNGTFIENGEKLQPGVGRYLKSGERFYLSNPNNLFEIRIE